MDDDERHDYATGRGDKRDGDDLRYEELARGAGWLYLDDLTHWVRRRKGDRLHDGVSVWFHANTAREACIYDDLI